MHTLQAIDHKDERRNNKLVTNCANNKQSLSVKVQTNK